MKLPVAPQTYQPTSQALVRAVNRVQVMLARLSCREAELSGAIALTDADHPDVPMANFAADVHVPSGMTAGQVLEQIQAHYESAGLKCLWLAGNEVVWPVDLLEAAGLCGYVPMPALQVRLLNRYQPPRQQHAGLQIIPSRAALGQVRQLLERAGEEQGAGWGVSPGNWAQVLVNQLDEPRVESYLGRLDHQPVGMVNVVSVGQIGVLKSLYVDPTARRQGVAGRLMDHALDFCQRAMFEQVILECLPDDPLANWYDRLGFVPVAQHCKLRRQP